MGWSFAQGASKSDTIRYLTKGWENETQKTVILTKSVRGNVLYYVAEVTLKGGCPAIEAKPLEPGQRWAAYQNHDLGHPDIGRLAFLKVGPGCTFPTPPERRPDTPDLIGWRYLHVGFVDLASGVVVDSPD